MGPRFDSLDGAGWRLAWRRRGIFAVAGSVLLHAVAVQWFTVTQQVTLPAVQSTLDVVLLPAPPSPSFLDTTDPGLAASTSPRSRPVAAGAAPDVSIPAESFEAQTAAHPDHSYHAASDLDGLPRLLTPLAGVHSALPTTAARGEAVVTVWIDWSGQVHRVDVREADDATAGNLIRSTLLAARFEPAMRAGRAVNSRVTLRVRTAAEGATP